MSIYDTRPPMRHEMGALCSSRIRTFTCQYRECNRESQTRSRNAKYCCVQHREMENLAKYRDRTGGQR
jgi:hypothetical protein